MARIDAHHHCWRYLPQDYPWIDDSMSVLQQDYVPAQLRPLLAEHGLDGAVVVQARHDIRETDWLIARSADEAGVHGVVGWLDITAADFEETLALRRSGLCGLRHQVQDDADPGAWLARADVARGMTLLQREGLCWDLLVTHRHLPEVARFAARHDQHWLVLDHFGKPDIPRGAAHWAEQVAPLAVLPHVACKLSGLVTEAEWGNWQAAELLPFFRAAVDLFGPERLMFGSDWPVCLLSAEYRQVYRLCETALAPLNERQRAAVWGGTASRIYGLTEASDGSVS
ncbi:TPA: amidohydrolase family protein [Pluralibacter gergoviae]